jgi:putative DNA primase/helicase
LKQQAGYVARSLLGIPTKRSDENELYFGSKKGSLKVTVRGQWAGRCYEYATNESFDLLSLIQRSHGCGFLQAVEIAEDLIGNKRPDDPEPPRQQVSWVRDAEQKRVEALRIWDEAKPLLSSPLVEQYYVEHRKIPIRGLGKFDHVLRWSPSECAVVALVTDIETGAPQAIHRTFLSTIDGNKIGRKYLAPVGGGVIRLCHDVSITDRLCIGEGVETCLAGMVLGLVPMWATGSAGSLATFPVLNEIHELTILADMDEQFTGQNAAVTCGTTWTKAGKTVFVAHNSIGDANDVLIKRGDLSNDLYKTEV